MSECKICGTDRLNTDFKSSTRCKKCDRVIRLKNKFKKLTFENPDDRTILKDKFSWSWLKTEEEFNELKALYLDAINLKISSYNNIESHMRKDVDATDIEYFLRFHLRDLFPTQRREHIEAKFSRYAGRFREMSSVERNAVYRTQVWIWEDLLTRVHINIDPNKENILKAKYHQRSYLYPPKA